MFSKKEPLKRPMKIKRRQGLVIRLKQAVERRRTMKRKIDK